MKITKIVTFIKLYNVYYINKCYSIINEPKGSKIFTFQDNNKIYKRNNDN